MEMIERDHLFSMFSIIIRVEHKSLNFFAFSPNGITGFDGLNLFS
jgi:hypothetical protein